LMKLLFATRNRGKLAELRALAGERFEVLSLDDVPPMAEVEEDAQSFEGNAGKKALAAAQATGMTSLADDSGLCVDALGGDPGVRSARYAPGDDRARCEKVLRALDRTDDANRDARFVCVLALAFPHGLTVYERGECRGRIARAPRGTNGFGYDPIFEVEGQGKTMAELSTKEKSAISHRGKAFRLMLPRLEALVRGVRR
jgi:XTP/dITP diphosphohydrolase